MSFRRRLEHYFEFKKLGTDWKTEILAGLTTFITMAYIVFVNPSILHDAGRRGAAPTAATCVSAAAGSLLMGAFARYPIALAPGMGLNAYFTYVVVKGLGIPWQAALGAVFVSGVVFLVIAVIGFRNAGIVVASSSTLVTLGNLRQASTVLAILGLLLTAALLAWRVRPAILVGTLATTGIALATGVAKWTPQAYRLSDLSATTGKLDVAAALRLGLVEIVFVFLFIDLFDNLGTLVAVGKRAGLFDEAPTIPRINRILVADATASIVGSLTGTSTVVSYVESAAGVEAGGRSGVTAIVTGLLFICALFAAPAVGVIPNAATAPALIVVGCLMMSVVREIDWLDAEASIPAFLTMLAIPLTFSIANGLAFGFIAFAALKVLRGKWRQVNWLVYVLAGLFLARFVWLGAG
jgi:AGZA family xanthine/uracil permease-like MFS transporter